MSAPRMHVLHETGRSVEQKINILDWIEKCARANPDKTVMVRFVKEGEWDYTHGDPTKDLERENANLLIVLWDLEKWWAANHPNSMPTVRVQVRAALSSSAPQGRSDLSRAPVPSSGVQSPADAELLADVRELRERWLRIVVDQSWGDNFDGDFTTLDAVIERLEAQ